jgi:hypothetical protein
VRGLDSETSIIPRAIAAGVLEEASVWLDTPVPRRWIDELTARANTVYALNPRFRQTLRSKGNLGRDRLWAFIRHWLCALISEYRPSLLARLPTHYQAGYPLPHPARSDGDVHCG